MAIICIKDRYTTYKESYLYSSLFAFISMALKERRPSWRISSTDRLVHADLSGDEELLHGHHVHVGKVLHHKPLAFVLVMVTSAC